MKNEQQKKQDGIWAGFKPCGCLVAVARVCDPQGYDVGTYNQSEIWSWLNQGLTVRHATPDEWDSTLKASFLVDCQHES